MTTRDILYYDGACPLCRAEVGKLARMADTSLSLQDIHLLPDGASQPSKTEMLARLHLRRANGEWLTGMAANIQAWQHTPLWWCWKALDLPLIRWFSYGAYELWLKWRQWRQRRSDQQRKEKPNEKPIATQCHCRSE